MKRSSSALLAAAGMAMMAAAGMSVLPTENEPAAKATPEQRADQPTTTLNRSLESQAQQALDWERLKHTRRNYPNGPGWSNLKVRRMAAKRRNRIRNRLAHR